MYLRIFGDLNRCKTETTNVVHDEEQDEEVGKFEWQHLPNIYVAPHHASSEDI